MPTGAAARLRLPQIMFGPTCGNDHLPLLRSQKLSDIRTLKVHADLERSRDCVLSLELRFKGKKTGPLPGWPGSRHRCRKTGPTREEQLWDPKRVWGTSKQDWQYPDPVPVPPPCTFGQTGRVVQAGSGVPLPVTGNSEATPAAPGLSVAEIWERRVGLEAAGPGLSGRERGEGEGHPAKSGGDRNMLFYFPFLALISVFY